MHINPDHFLQTDAGRVVTPERNRAAWAQAYQALDEALRTRPAPSMVYLLIGPQGAGKSSWVRRRSRHETNAVFFDAILVKRAERREVLARLQPLGVPATAVWLRTPLHACLDESAETDEANTP
ncbi:MAG TPA: hypothetical protein H9903_08855 [Candidatus Aquabacterium excrementipullorum]|nr:hypothetical protein [Candidatus Aquabacterium excrementipullorum]